MGYLTWKFSKPDKNSHCLYEH